MKTTGLTEHDYCVLNLRAGHTTKRGIRETEPASRMKTRGREQSVIEMSVPLDMNPDYLKTNWTTRKASRGEFAAVIHLWRQLFHYQVFLHFWQTSSIGIDGIWWKILSRCCGWLVRQVLHGDEDDDLSMFCPLDSANKMYKFSSASADGHLTGNECSTVGKTGTQNLKRKRRGVDTARHEWMQVDGKILSTRQTREGLYERQQRKNAMLMDNWRHPCTDEPVSDRK